MEKYTRTDKLGEGTWGIVWAAVDKTTGRKVALKSISSHIEGLLNGGLNYTALREVKLLQELHHENIIELVDVFVEAPSTVVLAFEVCVSDLEDILVDPSLLLTPADVKGHFVQLMRATEHLHKHWILHRDIKPANMLYTSGGVMKLTDFGLARSFGDRSAIMSSNVVTVWYRPPELLYGAIYYGAAVDVWSVGCVFAELMLRRPLFSGGSDTDQLAKIYQIMGTPTAESWPAHQELTDYVEFSPQPPLDLKNILTAASADALDLLRKMLVLNPAKRITMAEAMAHSYFAAAPEATLPAKLPLPAAARAKAAAAEAAAAAVAAGSAPGPKQRKQQPKLEK